LVIANAVGRFAGSIILGDFDPGVSLRSTPGFMLSAASRALEVFWVGDPGVSLRFTPGFMLPAAPRTLIVFNGCLSHFLDFTYDSPRSLNHIVLIR
jgi:hypothetical protein